VEELDSGLEIGRVGFWQPPSRPNVELTWLVRRSPWGQGFATEAAHRAVAWLRADTRIDRVVSLIHPDNSRSIRVASKLGQTQLAVREVAGVVHHEYGLSLTR
jgi:ribosomal-protein-alanine N-acetyltransferase